MRRTPRGLAPVAETPPHSAATLAPAAGLEPATFGFSPRRSAIRARRAVGAPRVGGVIPWRPLPAPTALPAEQRGDQPRGWVVARPYSVRRHGVLRGTPTPGCRLQATFPEARFTGWPGCNRIQLAPRPPPPAFQRPVGWCVPLVWSLPGLNRRPSACHADALPAELRPQSAGRRQVLIPASIAPPRAALRRFPGGVAAACGAAAGVKGTSRTRSAAWWRRAGPVTSCHSTVEFSNPPGGGTCPCPQVARGTEQG